MANSIDLEIAGINIAVYCEDAIILPYHDPSYKSFLKNDVKSPTVHPDIRIDLRLENIPETVNLPKYFDSSQSWSMFRNNDEIFFAFSQTVDEKTPIFLAKSNHDFNELTVYCSKKLVTKTNGRLAVLSPFCYPLDQIILMYHMAQRSGALIHAAGVDLKGRGYIFPGKSGAGKSTLSRQLASRQYMKTLSDDRIVIREVGDTIKMFGTPWPGEGEIAANKGVPLVGIFFLVQSGHNSITGINPREALEKILPVVSIPWYDKQTLTTILLFCENLTSCVPSYELYFKPEARVADLLEKFVIG